MENEVEGLERTSISDLVGILERTRMQYKQQLAEIRATLIVNYGSNGLQGKAFNEENSDLPIKVMLIQTLEYLNNLTPTKEQPKEVVWPEKIKCNRHNNATDTPRGRNYCPTCLEEETWNAAIDDCKKFWEDSLKGGK